MLDGDKLDKVKIIAFDPGTANMGYAVLIGDYKTKSIALDNHFGVIKTSKWNESSEVPIRDRIDSLGAEARKLISIIQPHHIVIEDFVEQGKFVGKTYKEMSYLIEHMRLVGKDFGIYVDIYTNGFWKRKTLKATHANKLQVQHFISYKFPQAKTLLYKQPDHVWDSVGIGYCKWQELIATS